MDMCRFWAMPWHCNNGLDHESAHPRHAITGVRPGTMRDGPCSEFGDRYFSARERDAVDESWSEQHAVKGQLLVDVVQFVKETA